MTSLAKKDDISTCGTLNIVFERISVKMWNYIEFCQHFRTRTNCTQILFVNSFVARVSIKLFFLCEITLIRHVMKKSHNQR